jgi:hypothetical protein
MQNAEWAKNGHSGLLFMEILASYRLLSRNAAAAATHNANHNLVVALPALLRIRVAGKGTIERFYE